MQLSIVMVTHDLDTLTALSDRIAVLAEKKVVAIGSIQEISNHHHPFIDSFFMGKKNDEAIQ